MKHTLVLVLVQICICFKVKKNLNDEIIKHLSELKLNSSSEPQNALIPGPDMIRNASSCVSTFSRELKNLLKNMTHSFTKADAKHIIQLQRLEANLRELGKHQVDNGQCNMTQVNARSSTWINKYIHFLKKLNNSG